MNSENPAFNDKDSASEHEQSNTEANSTEPSPVATESLKSRETPYLNTWMGMTHIEYWNANPGDTMSGEKVSDFMTQMWNRLKYPAGFNYLEKGGPFQGYKIHTYHPSRAAAEGGLSSRDAGLTDWQRSRINAAHLVDLTYGTGKDILGGIYAHEFAHNYHMACGLHYDGKVNFLIYDDAARALADIYRKMRAGDFTANTNEVERMTEDIKYFFGTDHIAHSLNKGDDAYLTGGKVRWAKDIKGLELFLRGMWPVYSWMRDKKFRNFTYTHANGLFQWDRLLGGSDYRREKFDNGMLYRFDGHNWHPFNKRSTVYLKGNHEKWMRTGVQVVKGENIHISASGLITFFIGGNYPFPPAGEPTKVAGGGAPAQGLIANSLVARTGGAPVYIGNGRTIVADASTELLVAANDDFFPDNGGYWTINIDV